jgi:hypothetical protein
MRDAKLEAMGIQLQEEQSRRANQDKPQMATDELVSVSTADGSSCIHIKFHDRSWNASRSACASRNFHFSVCSTFGYLNTTTQYFRTRSFNLKKLGVPRPVTIQWGSLVSIVHHSANEKLTGIPSFSRLDSLMSWYSRCRGKGKLTLKPGVPHPGLFPDVMSVSPLTPFEYRNGLRNPRGGSLAFNLASFNKATIPANAGEEAEVPPMDLGTPLNQILKNRPSAAMSGKA